MPSDAMFWLATGAFAWGLSLATYRWVATYNEWPMGEWQAHRPGLPIAIGLLSALIALLFGLARGEGAVFAITLLGLVLASFWTAATRVGAQAALLLAPLSVVALLVTWLIAASHVPLADTSVSQPTGVVVDRPAATEREGDKADRDRGITRSEPRLPSPISR